KLKPAAATAPPARPWWEELFRKENPQEVPFSPEEANKAAFRNAADSLRGGLAVSPIKNTKMVRVSFASPNPRLAADVLNSLAQMDEIDKSIKAEIDAVKRSVETAYQGLLMQQKSIHARLEQTKKDVLDLQGRSIRYNILKRDVDTDRAIYNSLLQRLNEVGVTGGTGANNVS